MVDQRQRQRQDRDLRGPSPDADQFPFDVVDPLAVAADALERRDRAKRGNEVDAAWFEPVEDIQVAPARRAAPPASVPVPDPSPAPVHEAVAPEPEVVDAPVEAPRVTTWSDDVAATQLHRDAPPEAAEAVVNPPAPPEPLIAVRPAARPAPVVQPFEDVEESEEAERERLAANRARIQALADRVAAQALPETAGEVDSADELSDEDDAARIEANRARMLSLAARLSAVTDEVEPGDVLDGFTPPPAEEVSPAAEAVPAEPAPDALADYLHGQREPQAPLTAPSRPLNTHGARPPSRDS